MTDDDVLTPQAHNTFGGGCFPVEEKSKLLSKKKETQRKTLNTSKRKKKETRGHIIHQNVSFFVFLLHKILLETRERL